MKRPRLLVDGKVDVIDLDPEQGAYLVVERPEPVPGEPWRFEPVLSRYGLFSVASVELADVVPDEAA